MVTISEPYLQKPVLTWCTRIAKSYKHWFGRDLIQGPEADEAQGARKLYEAGFVLVSHRYEKDEPRFCYVNRAAQELWGYGWDEFTGLPSRLSAEPDVQPARQALLEKAQAEGSISDYEGIRITKDGRRFIIKNVLLWNVLDEQDHIAGQAAMFDTWEFINTEA